MDAKGSEGPIIVAYQQTQIHKVPLTLINEKIRLK